MGMVRNKVQADYYCLGEKVAIVPTADVRAEFLSNGQYGRHVADILDGITEPWTGLEWVGTVGGFPEMPSYVVARRPGQPIEWAQHLRHKARNPGLSPFIRGAVPVQTDTITVHLIMRGGGPVLTRAYAGPVQPPLPWMASAKSYDKGGVQGCVEFWREHAYVFKSEEVRRTTLTATPPDWAR